MKHFIFLIILFLSSVASAEQLTTAGEAVKTIYPASSSYDVRQIELSSEQQALISRDADITFGESHHPQLRLYTVKQADAVIGYAFEDVVMGRWGPIHYLAGLSPDGHVVQVVVLDYQEIRGRPVAKKRFLKQYKNKTVKHSVKLKIDIDGITGATVSSRSLTDGVRKILNIFNILKDSLAK